ncbi:unnamed protein product [Pleuronectes platessa]|uniref:Uncharacterized protein n=1 Tax=Pleuronectes platessa TaxID=8262 RepID=A0A9N7VBN7_PLEPL|nr:unnamed protein product [Pleuronectes platessa]
MAEAPVCPKAPRQNDREGEKEVIDKTKERGEEPGGSLKRGADGGRELETGSGACQTINVMVGLPGRGGALPSIDCHSALHSDYGSELLAESAPAAAELSDISPGSRQTQSSTQDLPNIDGDGNLEWFSAASRALTINSPLAASAHEFPKKSHPHKVFFKVAQMAGPVESELWPVRTPLNLGQIPRNC